MFHCFRKSLFMFLFFVLLSFWLFAHFIPKYGGECLLLAVLVEETRRACTSLSANNSHSDLNIANCPVRPTSWQAYCSRMFALICKKPYTWSIMLWIFMPWPFNFYSLSKGKCASVLFIEYFEFLAVFALIYVPEGCCVQLGWYVWLFVSQLV